MLLLKYCSGIASLERRTALNPELCRRAGGHNVKSIEGARKHRVITDRCREFHQAPLAQSPVERLKRRFAHPMVPQHLAYKAHDLGFIVRKLRRIAAPMDTA